MTETSSQNVPRHDVVEDLTPRKLLASLRSDICPACGQSKLGMTSLCGACRRQLPQRLRAALDAPHVDDGYDAAMAQAMRILGADRLVLGRAEIVPTILRVPLLLERLTPELLQASFISPICPKCANAKDIGAPLCHPCTYYLHNGVAPRVARETQTSRREMKEQLSNVEIALNPAMLSSDVDRYRRAMLSALRWMKTRVFHYPEPKEESCRSPEPSNVHEA